MNTAQCKKELVKWCSNSNNISDIHIEDSSYSNALLDIKQWKRYKKIKRDTLTILRVFYNEYFEGTLIAEVITDNTDTYIIHIETQEWPAYEWRREY